MPFTISHVAAVLPFSRPLERWKLMPATVVGAMVPDFRLFLHMARFETHSFEALFTFCLPVGLLTYWVFEYLIKPPVLETLPDGTYARWLPHRTPASIRSLQNWLLAAFGVLLGAVSHLVWDAFTHEGARGMRMLALLDPDDPIFDTKRHQFLFMRLAQDGSSLIGLLVVVAFAVHALTRHAPLPRPERLLAPAERHGWMLAYVLAAIAITVPIFSMRPPGEHRNWLPIVANDLAIASLRALAIALLAVSVSLATRLRYLSSDPDP